MMPIKPWSICWLCAMFIQFFVAMVAAEQTPHVHGAATLNIAVEGDAVLMEFDSPVINLLGFEHAPVSDEQQALLLPVRKTLQQAHRLFSFAAASCQLESADVQMPGLQSDQEDEHRHDHAEVHSDIRASYWFRCREMQALKTITIHLFALFPGIHQIKVHWIFHGTQGATELTSSLAVLKVR